MLMVYSDVSSLILMSFCACEIVRAAWVHGVVDCHEKYLRVRQCSYVLQSELLLHGATGRVVVCKGMKLKTYQLKHLLAMVIGP